LWGLHSMSCPFHRLCGDCLVMLSFPTCPALGLRSGGAGVRTHQSHSSPRTRSPTTSCSTRRSRSPNTRRSTRSQSPTIRTSSTRSPRRSTYDRWTGTATTAGRPYAGCSTPHGEPPW
jgi:hypothetical protein